MYLFTSVILLGKNASFRFVLRMWLRHSQTTRLEAQQWLRNRVTLPPPRLAAPCFSLLTLPRNDVIFKVAARLVITLDLGQVFFKFTRWLITSLISCLLLCNRHTQSSPTVLLLGAVARRGLQVGVFRASFSQTSTRLFKLIRRGRLLPPPPPVKSNSVNSRPRSKILLGATSSQHVCLEPRASLYPISRSYDSLSLNQNFREFHTVSSKSDLSFDWTTRFYCTLDNCRMLQLAFLNKNPTHRYILVRQS